MVGFLANGKGCVQDFPNHRGFTEYAIVVLNIPSRPAAQHAGTLGSFCFRMTAAEPERAVPDADQLWSVLMRGRWADTDAIAHAERPESRNEHMR